MTTDAWGPPPAGAPGGSELSRAERRRARIRSTIADTALRMFLSRGYDATTVEDVAAAVDMSPRTVFRYFPFKEDMLREAIHFELAELADALRSRPAHEHPADALREAMTRLWSRIVHQPEELRALLRLMSELPRARGLLLEATRTNQEALLGVLAPRLGLDATDLSARIATACALATLNAVVEAWTLMPAGTDLLPLLREGIDDLKHGPLRVRRGAGTSGRGPS